MSNYSDQNLIQTKAINKARAIKIGNKILTGFAEGGGTSMQIYKCATVDTSNSSWTGYLYDATTQSIASTATSLTYTSSVAPTVGKYYTEDGNIECDVYTQNGVILYVPLRASASTDETGKTLTEYNASFATEEGVSSLNLTGVGQCISYPTNLLSTGSPVFSCSVFAKYKNGTGIYGLLVGFGNPSGQQWFSITRDNSLIAMNGWDTGNVITFTSNIDTDWHHYAISFNGTILTGWYDGTQIGTASWSPSLAQLRASIGGWYWEQSTDRQWYGNIAEVRFWNRTLTQSEVTAEYNRLQSMLQDQSSSSSPASSPHIHVACDESDPDWGGMGYDVIAGDYYIVDDSATGYDRVWKKQGEDYYLYYDSSNEWWTFRHNDTELSDYTNFDIEDPWEGVFQPTQYLTVTYVE